MGLILNVAGKDSKAGLWATCTQRYVAPVLAALPNLLLPESDPGLGEIVRGELESYFVTRNDADVVLTHFSGDVSQDRGSVRELYAEHCPRQDVRDGAFGFDAVFFRHGKSVPRWQL